MSAAILAGKTDFYLAFADQTELFRLDDREAIARYSQMVFVICTGSPEYELSADVLAEDCVSSEVFSKLVSDIRSVEQIIVRLLEDDGTNLA
ncbi:hypothetical protein [Desulfopila sp. IMCC35008]|uniref:hypothetical protein n=1 Tax=Desulfopila sp. IMCC35008 TaxID=2653858 RepID=UPI0013D31908|nr:hypothetical protein [Desulfopila sp. IMCC35008]